jgi:high-affinity Fe2+/Pb2+ permease
VLNTANVEKEICFTFYQRLFTKQKRHREVSFNANLLYIFMGLFILVKFLSHALLEITMINQ